MRSSFTQPTLAAAAVVIVACSCKPEIKTNLISGSRTESVGQVIADEAARLLGAKGGKVLLVLDNSGVDPTDACYGYRKGFEKGLKRHPQLSLAGIAIQPYPDGTERDPTGLKFIYYQRLGKEFPNAACVVSLDEAPKFTADEMAQWDPATRPKLMALYSPTPTHSSVEMVRQGIVQALIFRTNPSIPTTEPQGTYREVFDKFFTVVTVDNLEKFVGAGQ